MHTSKSSLLALSLGLMLAAGCSKTSSDTTPPEPVMTEPLPPPPVVQTEPTPPPEPTPAAEPMPPAPPPLSDGEIAALGVLIELATAGFHRVAPARIAAWRAGFDEADRRTREERSFWDRYVVRVRRGFELL